ncbi:MAG: hypothetical protein OXG58_10600 [Gemmatimonadetes bacterium]|nr:hypothetical protein [Gemmatimonadota bacterium]MCY3942449.1 hypothetical protein [Gemmatimonadota bacterium]
MRRRLPGTREIVHGLLVAAGMLSAFATGGAEAQLRGTLGGQVMIGEVPADTGTVVLHRVSAAFSGSVDSVRVGRDGAFELPIPATTEPGELFFAAIHHQGVLYFGPTFNGAPETRPYLIQAYPALRSGPANPAELRARSIFATRTDSTGWQIAELFELHNGYGATLVSESGVAAWSHALPADVADVDVGASGMGTVVPVLEAGRIAIVEPLPPGANVFFVRYAIAASHFEIPLEVPTGSMEILVREPADDVAVVGLLDADPVEVDGSLYRRFAARDVAPSMVTVRAGSDGAGAEATAWTAVIVALVLAGMGAALAARQRPRHGGEQRRGPSARRREAVTAIARLDADRAAGRIPEEEHRRRRGALLEEIGRAHAAGGECGACPE